MVSHVLFDFFGTPGRTRTAGDQGQGAASC